MEKKVLSFGSNQQASVSRCPGAEGERKTNSFSVSVSRSRLVIFRQADKQQICQREPSSVTHFARPHVLYPRARRMTAAAVLVWPENLSVCVSVFVCVHM